MLLGKIVGTAVATIKYPGLDGVKLLVVQPLNKKLQPIGGRKVAADAGLRAGFGDVVVMVRSREASLALDVKGTPTDLAVVGIVETVDVTESGFSYILKEGYTEF
ncbi:MAG TPA: ethanolamine utilization protein EutN [Anaerolineae bacterium]|nr:ethanolamine utilization protein EutN [Anaerolineae bacterium]